MELAADQASLPSFMGLEMGMARYCQLARATRHSRRFLLTGSGYALCAEWDLWNTTGSRWLLSFWREHYICGPRKCGHLHVYWHDCCWNYDGCGICDDVGRAIETQYPRNSDKYAVEFSRRLRIVDFDKLLTAEPIKLEYTRALTKWDLQVNELQAIIAQTKTDDIGALEASLAQLLTERPNEPNMSDKALTIAHQAGVIAQAF